MKHEYSDFFFPLRPLRKDPTIPHIIAFDTEDNGKGAPQNFLCGCIYEGTNPADQHVFWTREEMRAHIFKQHQFTTLAVAHNLAYDLWNIDYPENTAELIHAKSRLIGAVHHYGDKKQMRMLDTGNFFVGASIDSLGTQLGYKKLGCKCERHLFDPKTGICPECNMFSVHCLRDKEQHKLPDELKANMAEYCMRDAEICYRTMEKLVNLATKHKTRFKCFTAPSLAMRVFRSNFMNGKWLKRTMEINDIERLAYYGGRTEAYDYRMHPKLFAEDIRSSYPSAMMSKTFPDPTSVSRTRLSIEEALKHEGVSMVTVHVPDMHIPPLPYRREDGKLIFPIGTWTGVYTHPELKMAIKHGTQVLEIHESLIYTQTFEPFKQFVEAFYHLKDTSKGIDREFYKLLLNCFSEDTTILTTEGHKNIKDIKIGDTVYSINPTTLQTEIKSVINTFAYCYFGKMVHINSGKKIDMLVTPNHRMFMAGDNGNERYNFIQAKNITYHHFPKLTPISGQPDHIISLEKYVQPNEDIITNDGERLWSPPHAKYKRSGVKMEFTASDLLELGGWYVSEGNVNSDGIQIVQSLKRNPENCKIIEGLLDRLRIRYSVIKNKTAGTNIYRFYHRLLVNYLTDMYGEFSSTKIISPDIFKYDHSLLERLFIAMMRGDGCMATHSTKSSQTLKYTTKSLSLAKAFQRLCIHLGLLSRIHYEHCNDKRFPSFVYRVFIYRIENFKVTKHRGHANVVQNNSPMVYCIEVADNHTVIAGRNGTMHVTGQSLSGKWGEKRSQSIRGNINDPHTASLLCNCLPPNTSYPGTNMCQRCTRPILEISQGVEIVDGWISINGCRQIDPKSAFPVLIAYITAYGRIKLFEERLQYGNKNNTIIYGDTDSCMSIDAPPIEVGPNLGQWERITYEHFIAFAPKHYEFLWKNLADGKRMAGSMKLKGVPRSAKTIYECFRGHQTEEQLLPPDQRCPICGVPFTSDNKKRIFERPVRMSEAIRRHLPPNIWIEVTKRITHTDDKRIRKQDGTSNPIKVTAKQYSAFTELLEPEFIIPETQPHSNIPL